jgi:hypothetical protein
MKINSLLDSVNACYTSIILADIKAFQGYESISYLENGRIKIQPGNVDERFFYDGKRRWINCFPMP